MCQCLTELFIEINRFISRTAKKMNFTLPFCHLRLVCDQNSQTTHTLTARAHGNTACDFQSAHRPTVN